MDIASSLVDFNPVPKFLNDIVFFEYSYDVKPWTGSVTTEHADCLQTEYHLGECSVFAVVNDSVELYVIPLGSEDSMLVHDLLSTDDEHHSRDVHIPEQEIQQKASDD